MAMCTSPELDLIFDENSVYHLLLKLINLEFSGAQCWLMKFKENSILRLHFQKSTIEPFDPGHF